MNNIIDITELFKDTGMDHRGKVRITHQDMTGLEPDPKDDWLYLGLLALKEVGRQAKGKIHSAAFIGSGNGIETIAALKLLPELETIFVTDLVKDVQPGIIENINENANEELKKVRIHCLEGRDCHPLPEKVDLIYGNLPLLMAGQEEINRHPLSRTTLTDEEMYMGFSYGHKDNLRRWSLLSQLGFLMSAKEKLTPHGSILTFIGGRVPGDIIEECFKRAGLKFKKLFTSFMRQSDAQFLKQYAEYETNKKVKFAFYDYNMANQLIKESYGIKMPEIIPGATEAKLKTILKPALLSANQAYQNYLQGRPVGHIAYALEAWDKNN